MSEKTNDIPVNQDKTNECMKDVVEKMDTDNEDNKINKSLIDNQDVSSDGNTNQSCTANVSTTEKPTEELVDKNIVIDEKIIECNINNNGKEETSKEENKISHKSNSIINGESCKRKLDESDDQAAKISRTFSTNDAFSDDRNKTMTTLNDSSLDISSKIDTSEPVQTKLIEEKKSNSTENLSNGENKNSNHDTNDTNMLIDTEECNLTNDKNDKVNDDTSDIPIQTTKSRLSIEVIYDKSKQPPKKPEELVEIDEEGEKIVLDSSQENNIIDVKNIDDDNLNKSSTDLKEDNKITKAYVTNGNDDEIKTSTNGNTPTHSNDSVQQKLPEVLNLVSDSEGESFMNEDVNTDDKILSYTKEISFTVKLKTVYYVDKFTKEIVNKEIVSVDCLSDQPSHSDSCPGDVSASDKELDTSLTVPSSKSTLYKLPKYPRASMISTVSSSSSSSTESNKNDNEKNNNEFCLPQGVPKHARKVFDESNDKLKKDWKNVNLLTTNILELMNTEVFNSLLESESDDSLEERKLKTSTPEVSTETKRSINAKSKSIKKNKSAKKSKSLINAKISKKSPPANGDSPVPLPSTPTRPLRCTTSLRNNTPRAIAKDLSDTEDLKDSRIGKICFAKWTHDKIYYPARVVKKSKDNFLDVKFLDGQAKTMNENLVVPLPKTLVDSEIHYRLQNTRYSYVATVKSIVDSNVPDDEVQYVVLNEENKEATVYMKDIFLSGKEIKMLQNKEPNNVVVHTSPKLTVTPTKKSSSASTPKSAEKKSNYEVIPKVLIIENAPSSSSAVDKVEIDLMINCLRSYTIEKDGFNAVQEEITDMPNDVSTKGPVNRMKGKAKNTKKKEDQEIIKQLGPIPPAGSKIFSGMCFMIVCVPVQTLERYADENPVIDSNSEPGTDNELEWTRQPLLRDRLTEQIKAGGGIVYEKFNDIPPESYGITKLVTNVPNSSLNSLLCLSVGIKAYNHAWIIQSCQENKLRNASEQELPCGWSLEKKAYIEFSERQTLKPFNHAIAIIPRTKSNSFFVQYWRRIIQNLGGVVRVISTPSETFEEATFVLTSENYPDWLPSLADYCQCPLVSSRWVMQCLFEGKVVSYEEQLEYKHDYVKP